jgi:putative methionine-R-sulfoxide reductase with GAF domain
MGTELEAPPPPESAVNSMSALFEDDVHAVETMAKFTIVEALLNILPRACSYNEFARDMLLTLMRVVKAEAGSLLEVDHTTNTLSFRAVVGQSSDKVAKFKIPVGQGVVGYVAESKLPLVVANPGQEAKHLKSIGNAVGFEAKNLVAVPIIVRGRVYGVVELLNRLGEASFTASDVEMLTYACQMMSKAIEVRLMLNWVRHRSGASGPTEKAA